jgi:hypothetical protein
VEKFPDPYVIEPVLSAHTASVKLASAVVEVGFTKTAKSPPVSAGGVATAGPLEVIVVVA